jgi:nicotinamidase-related amidase
VPRTTTASRRARARSRGTALVLVDVINHFEFPGASELLAQALPMVERILALRRAAHAHGVPVIYANDNYEDWRADSRRIVQRCSRRGSRGASFSRPLAPTRLDYFVLKATNSGFYCTSLEPLLEALEVGTLVLCGLTADNCVLFTANDAYLRGYRLRIPADCVAAQRPADAARALAQMQSALKADIRPSATVRLGHRS